MEYTVHQISADLYQINLVHQTQEELAMIKAASIESLEYYYHEAVSKKLGRHASLLAIEDTKLFPFTVIGRVQFARGIGGI